MATVDISKIEYNAVAVLSTGGQINLDTIATNIAWEENESELAVRLNLTIRDIDNNGTRLATQIALCTAIILYYRDSQSTEWKEAFRGTVWEWNHSQVHDDEIVITAYDMLYYLQKSDDYGFFETGQSTQGIVQSIMSKWGIPVGVWSAPSITHEKEVLKTKKISAMMTEILQKASDVTGVRAFIRAREGRCDVIKPGTNTDIWTFSASTNLISASDRYSMTGLVTRVTILGKDDTDGAQRPPIVATQEGNTQYGTLQKILSIGSSTVEEMQTEAASIIKKDGKPSRKISLLSPDFPRIRKGDRIRLITDNVDDYFIVLSVSHNATNQQMQMEVEEL